VYPIGQQLDRAMIVMINTFSEDSSDRDVNTEFLLYFAFQTSLRCFILFNRAAGKLPFVGLVVAGAEIGEFFYKNIFPLRALRLCGEFKFYSTFSFCRFSVTQ
jgi:hypothetical protein